MNKNDKSNKPKKTCTMCVNCRSTLGNAPHLYCNLQSSEIPLPSRVCSCFNVAFVDGFSIPSK